MVLVDFIPFECVSIHLDGIHLIPVDPEVPFIVFFINMNSEILKFFCRKNPDDVPVYPREITIPWKHIKNVTITEGDVESRILIDFSTNAEFTLCDIIVKDEVLEKFEEALHIMLIRLQKKLYGRSEREARESIQDLSTFEDSDFGMERDMIISAASSSSGIIPSSYQSNEESPEIYAAASEEFQKTLERTPYVVEDTPPATQEDSETNIILCTPDECEIPANKAKPTSNFHVYEEILGTQENQDENIEHFVRTETASERAISPLSEGDFGGIVVPESDFEDTHSNCSDNELDSYVEKTLSNLKIIADASQGEEDIADASQENEDNVVVSLENKDIGDDLQENEVIENDLQENEYIEDSSDENEDIVDALQENVDIEDALQENQYIEDASHENVDIVENVYIEENLQEIEENADAVQEKEDIGDAIQENEEIVDAVQVNEYILDVVQENEDVPDALQEKEDVADAIQENEDIADAPQEKEVGPVSARSQVINVDQINRTVQEQAIEIITNSQVVFLNDTINKEVYPEKVDASGFEEIQELPKPALRRSRRKSVTEVSNEVPPENSDENNNESQTIWRMLQEDEDSRKEETKTTTNPIKHTETALSSKGNNQIEQKQFEDQTETKTKKGRTGNKTKKSQKKSGAAKKFNISSESEAETEEKKSPGKELSKISELKKTEETPRKKLKAAQKKIEDTSENNLPQPEEPTENPPQNQNVIVQASMKPISEPEVNNNEIEELPKRVFRKTRAPTTPTKNRKQTIPNLRESKKRFADSDSDEWTPHGIIKYKKLRRSVTMFDENPQKESFFSSYSRGATITKTRTRIVTRSNRFGDDSEAEGRKRASSLSSDSDDDFVKTVIPRQSTVTPRQSAEIPRQRTVITRRNSTNVPPNYNESPNTDESLEPRPKESVIVRERSLSTTSTPSLTISSTPRTPRRRLSHTPKFAFNKEPNARKCTLPFSFVNNEDDFLKSFKENLSQSTFGIPSEPEDIPEAETEDIPEAQTVMESIQSEDSEVEEARGLEKSDLEPVAPVFPPENGVASQNSDLETNIPATDPSKRPYKPFPVFTSESSNFNSSSPDTPKANIFAPSKRETKKAKFRKAKILTRREKELIIASKRSVRKPKENKLPPVILSDLTSPELDTAKINELNVQPYLFQDVPASQEIDIVRREAKMRQLMYEVNQAFGRHLSEKQFYLLAIEVFTMCLKSVHILTDLRHTLLFNFKKVFCNVLKLLISKK